MNLRRNNENEADHVIYNLESEESRSREGGEGNDPKCKGTFPSQVCGISCNT